MLLRVKKSWLLAAGGFALASAISAQHFVHGLPDFAAGLLMGVAIGLLILSLRKSSPCGELSLNKSA
jgi:F0F1-type ATP synthase assembly protein I